MTMTTPLLHAVPSGVAPKPSGPRPVVSYTVTTNSHYQSTPYEVAVVIRAATAEQAIDALDKTFSAVEAQLDALGKNAYVPRG